MHTLKELHTRLILKLFFYINLIASVVGSNISMVIDNAINFLLTHVLENIPSSKNYLKLFIRQCSLNLFFTIVCIRIWISSHVRLSKLDKYKIDITCERAMLYVYRTNLLDWNLIYSVYWNGKVRLLSYFLNENAAGLL